MPKIWRIIDIIQWAEVYFKEKNFQNPRSEIEWLLCSLLDCSRIDIYLRFEEPLIKDQLEVLRKWIIRRAKQEPLQYITNKCNFYGRDFTVNSSVLIPRPETERLIDIALDKIKKIDKPKIFEVGVGSGCIAITLGLERPDAEIHAIDISQKALKVASQNKTKLKAKNINLSKMDIFESSPEIAFDLFISNPPYIGKDEIEGLEKNVKDYEPLIALTDDQDGYKFYKKFAKTTLKSVKIGGYAILEVGIKNHPKEVSRIFSKQGYQTILKKDYNGDDRVLIVKVR